MKLSVVTTLYKSEPYIRDFYDRILSEANKLTNDFEIIFVNDGSPDDSLTILKGLVEFDSRVVVVDLSRNYGHHKAIMTGLEYAKGNFIFLIDSDLEESPELLGLFWLDLISDESVDVVYGVQARRKGGFFERLSGNIFFSAFNFFSDVKIPKNFLTVRLMRRRFVEALIKFPERDLVFSILNSLVGYKSKEVEVVKLDHSPTTYSFSKKVRLLFRHILVASPRPLLLSFNIGLLVVFFSVLLVGYLSYKKIMSGVEVDGWVSTVVAISFFGGLNMFFIGVVGAYIAEIFEETKKRPRTLVKHVYRKGE